MTRPIKPEPLDVEVIDVGPREPWHWRRWVIVAAVIAVFILLRSASIYVEALWFDSLGYASVYWYTFRLELALFFIFALLTVITLRGAFWLFERFFETDAFSPRIVTVNNQSMEISPARVLKPLAWAFSTMPWI